MWLFFFFWCWGLNPGPCACKENTLPTDLSPQPPELSSLLHSMWRWVRCLLWCPLAPQIQGTVKVSVFKIPWTVSNGGRVGAGQQQRWVGKNGGPSTQPGRAMSKALGVEGSPNTPSSLRNTGRNGVGFYPISIGPLSSPPGNTQRAEQITQDTLKKKNT